MDKLQNKYNDFVKKYGIKVNDENIIENIKTILKNIETFEEKVIKEFDSTNKYIIFNKLYKFKEKTEKIAKNLEVLEIIPQKILEDLEIIPGCNKNCKELFKESNYEELLNEYTYFKISIGVFDIPKISKKDETVIFNDVKENINKYNSKGLSKAFEEISKELSTGDTCNMTDLIKEGSTKKLTGGKVFTMATKVAENISEQIKKGEITMEDLLMSSKNFIDDIAKSEMLNNIPDNEGIKTMFSSLAETMNSFAEMTEEEKESKDIDEIIKNNTDLTPD